jgi:hypothetical protein
MHALPVRNYWFPLLLIFFGAAMLLHRLHVIWAGWAPVLWLAVAAGGGIMLFNGIVRRSRGGVFWGFFWFALGGACFLRTCEVVWLDPGIVVSGLLIVVGTGMILMYVVSPRDWHLLVPAACLLLVGGAILSTELGWFPAWDMAPVVNRWWPAGLVLSGAALIVNTPLSSRRRE